MSPSIDRPPWLEVLESTDTVLIAGAGGGFDLFSGLPLALWLESRGKSTVLANLTFSNIWSIESPWIVPGLKRIEASTRGDLPYFPERHLCAWFAKRGDERAVYCFEKTGVRPLAAAYRHLVEHHDVDAVVLADGGTDSLMRGDEPGLGTPHEDMLSIAAVDALEVPVKLLACVGFGVDAYHGVCHAHVLETIAALARAGGFLRALSLLPEMPEVRAYVEAVDDACSRPGQRPSIVNTSIASAIEGHYGDHHRTMTSASGSELWINPLMSQAWFFDLGAVADRVLYLEHLRDTESFSQLAMIIEGFHTGVKKRPWRDIPI